MPHLYLDDVACPFFKLFRAYESDGWRFYACLNVFRQPVGVHSYLHDWMVLNKVLLDWMYLSHSEFANCRTLEARLI